MGALPQRAFQEPHGQVLPRLARAQEDRQHAAWGLSGSHVALQTAKNAGSSHSSAMRSFCSFNWLENLPLSEVTVLEMYILIAL